MTKLKFAVARLNLGTKLNSEQAKKGKNDKVAIEVSYYFAVPDDL